MTDTTNWFHLGQAFAWSWTIIQWPVIFCLVVTGFAIVYYVGPDVKQEWVWITPGSVFATACWLVVSLGFRWYLAAFASYQKTYGAIGGVIVALLWFYLSGLSLLVGAELNAIIEHASAEGKDPGEKVPREKEPGAPFVPADFDDRRSAGARAGHPRASQILIGTIGLAIELAAVTWAHVRRTRRTPL